MINLQALIDDAKCFEAIRAMRWPDVECDEVYVVAGHKGHPESVRKKGGLPGDDA
jgi:hypothetical protein